jgi:hypothetical protein
VAREVDGQSGDDGETACRCEAKSKIRLAMKAPIITVEIRTMAPQYHATDAQVYGDDLAADYAVPAPPGTLALDPEGEQLPVIETGPGEASVSSALDVRSIQAVAAADQMLNGIHVWLVEYRPQGSPEGIRRLRDAGTIQIVLPGHGPAGGGGLLDANERYIRDFMVAAEAATTKAEGIAAMSKAYPDHQLPVILDYGMQAAVQGRPTPRSCGPTWRPTPEPPGPAPLALMRSAVEADLPCECHEVVEEVLLHDLSVVPPRNRAEVHLETPAGGRHLRAVRSLHRPGHGAGEVRDRTGPITGCEEHLVGPVVEVLVREGFEERDRLSLVRLDPMCRRLPRPANHGVGLVALGERFQVLGVPGVIQRLHKLHVPLFDAAHLSSLLRQSRPSTPVARVAALEQLRQGCYPAAAASANSASGGPKMRGAAGRAGEGAGVVRLVERLLPGSCGPWPGSERGLVVSARMVCVP